MNRLIIFLIAYCFISSSIKGQDNTYLGVEFGPKFDIYQYTDEGEIIYTKPYFNNLIFGITAGRDINETFYLETGFQWYEYSQSYRARGAWYYVVTSGIQVLQIPLRLKAKLNLVKDKFYLTTTIGHNFAINADYGASGSGGVFYKNPREILMPLIFDSLRIADTSIYSFRKTYSLIEAGITINYKFKNGLSLYLAGNYVAGLTKVIEINISYWVDNQPEQNATVFSNGDYFSIVLGLKYPVSKLWRKNKNE